MKGARFVLPAILAVCLVELLAAGMAYRDRIRSGDWETVESGLEALPPGEPVFVADTWLGPRARMELPRLRDWDAAAPADLHGTPRYAVLGLSGRADSPALRADRAGLPEPVEIGQEDLGPLTLTHFEQPGAAPVLADLLAPPGLQVEADGARCKREGNAHRCTRGRIAPQTAEIGYRPRRCVAVDVLDGTTVTLTRKGAQTGPRIRGHLGFHDFNGRLRSDAPVRLGLRVDGDTVHRETITDAQGWHAFEATVEPGTHDVALELLVTVQGTWAREGLVPRGHLPCVELRTLGEATP